MNRKGPSHIVHTPSLSLSHSHAHSLLIPVWLIFLVHFSECNRENEASLAVLPDLLMELDSMSEVCVCMVRSEPHLWSMKELMAQ